MKNKIQTGQQVPRQSTMIVHTIEIKIVYLFFIIVFIISCSIKPNKKNDYKTLKSFSFYEQSYKKDTIKYNSDNFIIKKIRLKNDYTIYYNLKKIFTYNSDSTSTLIEQFDKSFILISECIPNSMVATPIHLKRKKLWIIDTNSNKVYSVGVNNILIDSENKVRRINGIPHHENSAFGLVSIDVNKLKISLIETTQKIVNYDLVLVSSE